MYPTVALLPVPQLTSSNCAGNVKAGPTLAPAAFVSARYSPPLLSPNVGESAAPVDRQNTRYPLAPTVVPAGIVHLIGFAGSSVRCMPDMSAPGVSCTSTQSNGPPHGPAVD